MAGLIHCGAWEGLEYRGSTYRLLLFEPQAEPFAALQANFAGCDNVELVNVALGAKDGEATMHTAHPSHSSSLLAPVQCDDHITFEGSETVKVTTLDKAMKGHRGFDELRIDTQGYELEVLRGAPKTLKHIKRIELELHRPTSYPGAGSLEDIDAYLIPLGFVRTALDIENSDDLGDVTYEREETRRAC